MVKKPIENEVREALTSIEKGKNFILTGGAGSGKTYSLITLIQEVRIKYPQKTIVCITYTNNAVAEIRNRISDDDIIVSTIHEFIWSLIKKYQFEIKLTLVDLINDENQKKFYYPKEFEAGNKIEYQYFLNSSIEYDEYYYLQSNKASKISHDQILILAEKMFSKYSKLSDILKDIANFIFIDEYQDTDPLIKDILLNHLKKSTKENIVGFFGDSMQAIYDNGVGSILEGDLKRIYKQQNRRNPKEVIELANQIRDDEVQQVPSNDSSAPNILNGEVVLGSVKFAYGKNIEDLNLLRESKITKEWDFSDYNRTKELWLVQKANAQEAGFRNLYDLYNSDLVIELITKMKSKFDKSGVDLKNKNFISLAEESNICVRGRGNLLINIRNNPVYEIAFSWLRDKTWEEVKDYKIDKDSLLSFKFNGLTEKYEAKSKRDIILRKLDAIYELVDLFKKNKYNELLNKINKEISSFEEKRKLNNVMNKLATSNLKVGQVIHLISDIVMIEDTPFKEYINYKGAYLWERIKELSFNEYLRSIEYQKQHLPFATQHSIKGSEFDNILVVLDNGNWNKYNFEKMFKNFDSIESTVVRSKKLFYVCCTRAKKNLIVYMPTTDDTIIKKAAELFGERNIISISSD